MISDPDNLPPGHHVGVHGLIFNEHGAAVGCLEAERMPGVRREFVFADGAGENKADAIAENADG